LLSENGFIGYNVKYKEYLVVDTFNLGFKLKNIPPTFFYCMLNYG